MKPVCNNYDKMHRTALPVPKCTTEFIEGDSIGEDGENIVIGEADGGGGEAEWTDSIL
jgi:hypothetical protein